MKLRRCIIPVFLFLAFGLEGKTQSPDIGGYRPEQLEEMAEKNNAEPVDDSYLTGLDQFSRHPLNMNEASEEELIQLQIPDVLQIRNFLLYRSMLGSLLNIYELQAIPGWDMETIRKILPYVKVEQNESLYVSIKERWKGGDSDFLIRTSRVVEKSLGYDNKTKPNASYYTGSPENIFIRYTYNYKQLLGYGFTGEKDAGESFFRGAQRYGFDFYSFHFFLQHAGLVRSLAIGDFTVNLGQGLIQWQTFSLVKSSQTLGIKRESPCLKPYHSAGEFNFHRGLGISLQKGKWQSTLFVSYRKISTSLEADSIGQEPVFTSFQNSGYHRTAAEIADRNNNSQFATGANARYETRNFSMGFNLVHFHFAQPLQKRDALYNLYSLKGKNLSDFSMDYSYTLGNLHLFGEFARDQWLHGASVQGALISFGEHLDLGFLYRNISPAFQSLYSASFTENNTPGNEQGLYSGLSFKPGAGIRCDMYYDMFVFPWLKYRVDCPSRGRDFFFQVAAQPDKLCHLTASYKQEMKPINGMDQTNPMPALTYPLKKRIRIETDLNLSRSLQFNSHMEWLIINSAGLPPQHGFLGMAGMAIGKSGLTASSGVCFFETDNYDTRIYAYEPDLLYKFSLPDFYGRGLHYYINLHMDLLRSGRRAVNPLRVSAWIKWDQTFYRGVSSVGSGLDEIPGNRKSEIKAQVLVQWL